MSDHAFWHSRWQERNTPFHRADVHPMLRRHYERLSLSSDGPVFVPLCGKSVDMAWLRVRGHAVLGVELSEIACREFFVEQGFACEEEDCAPYRRFESERLTLLAGDVFELDAARLASMSAVYDRAALVALPGELRASYAAMLCERVPASAQMLLITLDYPQPCMEGPPFAVSDQEVRDLYAQRYRIELLEEKDIIDEEPRFRERGLDSLIERAYLLTAHAT